MGPGEEAKCEFECEAGRKCGQMLDGLSEMPSWSVGYHGARA